MEPSVSMDVDPIRLSKRKEPLNLLTGIFLKSVFFLDKDTSKKVLVGIFKNRGDNLGVAFSGRRGSIYWSNDIFNQFLVYFTDISNAFKNNTKFIKRLETGEDIKLQNVFGKQHAFLYDGESTITLNQSEWNQFTANLPLVFRELRKLFLFEDLIKSYIFQILSSKEVYETPPNGLSTYLSDRLFDEVIVYKNGCSS